MAARPVMLGVFPVMFRWCCRPRATAGKSSRTPRPARSQHGQPPMSAAKTAQTTEPRGFVVRVVSSCRHGVGEGALPQSRSVNGWVGVPASRSDKKSPRKGPLQIDTASMLARSGPVNRGIQSSESA
ncbi:hypothetical protein QBC45DRAFT_51420 [Copromyces sp. CBS 386.78]|nr:hypothetical protein QBC45DRAFT_51420 [Copromyces sp. CBS 386.78]